MFNAVDQGVAFVFGPKRFQTIQHGTIKPLEPRSITSVCYCLPLPIFLHLVMLSIRDGQRKPEANRRRQRQTETDRQAETSRDWQRRTEIAQTIIRHGQRITECAACGCLGMHGSRKLGLVHASCSCLMLVHPIRASWLRLFVAPFLELPSRIWIVFFVSASVWSFVFSYLAYTFCVGLCLGLLCENA